MEDSLSPVDPRRALGRRPGAQPPRLFLEDSALEDSPLSPSILSPPPQHTRHISLAIPTSSPLAGPSSPTSPSSPNTSRKFRRPTISRPKTQKLSSLKGLHETQKLLSHLLDHLESRDTAPDLLTRSAVAAREASGTTKGKGKGRAVRIGQAVAAAASTGLSVAQGNSHSGHNATGIGSEDLEDRLLLEDVDWDTDATCDLVEQTRGLLALALKQDLDLFGSSADIAVSNPAKSKRKAGRFSSFASPISPGKPTFDEDDSLVRMDSSPSISGDSLLRRLLRILADLINVDSLHRTHLFRLLRPTYALQAACLDIATYLYHKCGTAIKFELLELVIGALYAMGPGMAERICEWLEGRLGELLSRLTKERGGSPQGGKATFLDPFAEDTTRHDTTVPTFAISADPMDSTLPATSPGWLRYSPTSPTVPSFPFPLHQDIAGILSTHTASADMSSLSLQIASLVPRLLSAVASVIDLGSSKLTTIHRFHRLLSLVLTAKSDASLDLLELVAHAPPGPRRTALEILNTFYPNAMGHNSIARRTASTTYAAQRSKWETGQDKVLGEDSVDEHHFIPWRASSYENSGSSTSLCSVCSSNIHGFCIRCTLCHETRHLHCYRGDENGFHYDVVTLSSRDSAPTVVFVKFSLCPSRLDEKILDGTWGKGDSHATVRSIGQHRLHLVNLFTTTICDECRLPLWGSTCQAFACLNGCQRFYHTACSDRVAKHVNQQCHYGRNIVVDEVAAQGRDPFAITAKILEEDFDRECSHLCIAADQLTERTYDEIAILYGALWTQYQLLKNGLSSGAVRPLLLHEEESGSDLLKLRPYLKAYEEHLRLPDPEASSAATDYAQVANSGQNIGQGYLFSQRYLAYCTALLRAPSFAARSASPVPSEGFLTAQGTIGGQEPDTDSDAGAYELLEISTISRGMATDLNINDPHLAAIFLDQLRAIGLIAISTRSLITTKDVTQGSQWLSFPLPLLIDSSSTVELLIQSIEVLLDDPDLTMNEIALNLLCQRAWPSLLCSPYALERLGAAVIGWIMAQEDTLHQVVKLYASQHRRLPGVRTANKDQSSVQIYKNDRMALQVRYAHPWLEALHDQDPALYAHTVYEQCKSPIGFSSRPESSGEEIASAIAGIALERMTTMVNANIIFSVHLDLLVAWLEDLGALASKDVIYRSLPRLLRPTPFRNAADSDQPDIWQMAQVTSLEDADGFARVCKWLRVLSFSGVEVPWQIIQSLLELQQSLPSQMEANLDLAIAVNANATHIGHSEFASICCGLLVNFASGIDDVFEGKADQALELLKHILLVILRAYGVTLDDVVGLRLASDDFQAKQPASLTKRRRMTTSVILLTIDDAIVQAIGAIIDRGTFPAELLLDFMWLLFTRSTSAANIDGFLHKNAVQLYPVLWDLIDLPIERGSRSRVFLRLLAVNSPPMEQLVREQFHTGDRTALKERLLEFFLELVDDSLTYENISWRRASVGLIVLFFQALLDATDLNPDNLVIIKTLLPSQLEAASRCFEEYLTQCSDERRLNLLGRLRRLRMINPKWPVLSWKAIEDLLAETSASIAQMRPARSSQTISALLDAQLVRDNLIAIALELLAQGVEISWTSAQRLQQHVAGACALPWALPSDGLSTLVIPALRSVLDSAHQLEIGAHTMDARHQKRATVGALFVPVVIDFAPELDGVDFLTQRALLDLIMLVFYKQSTRTVELSALSALQAIAEFIATNDGIETRLLAIQILQTAASRVERDSFARAVPTVFGAVARSLVKETEAHGDQKVIEQMKSFLGGVVRTFGRSRLLVQLFKNDAIPSGPAGNELSLGKALLILQGSEPPFKNGTTPMTIVDMAINDLGDILKRGRQTVEQVLQSFERFTSVLSDGLSEDTTVVFGSFVNRLAKHIAEWDVTEFDPNPILRACASLLVLADAEASVTLLHQVSTFLHLCLSRFGVDHDSVITSLSASEKVSLARSTENTLRTVLFEISGSALSGMPISLITLDALLHFLTDDAFPAKVFETGAATQEQIRVWADSASGCVNLLLRRHPTVAAAGNDSDLLVSTLTIAALLLVQAEAVVPGTLNRHLPLAGEAAAVQIGVYTWLLYVSLDIGPGRNRLLALYPVIGRAVSLCLRASADLLSVQDAAGEGADLLSTVYAVFRLALLSSLEQAGGQDRSLASDVVETIWERIWPDWYRLLSLSVDQNCVNGPLRAVAHSTFIDTLIFLDATQSPLLITHAGTLAHSIRVMRRYQGTSTHGGAKLTRGEGILQSAGLSTGTEDKAHLVKTIKADLLAAERLRGLR